MSNSARDPQSPFSTTDCDFNDLSRRLMAQESGEWVARVFDVHSQRHCDFHNGLWRLDDRMLNQDEMQGEFAKLLSTVGKTSLEFAITRAHRDDVSALS